MKYLLVIFYNRIYAGVFFLAAGFVFNCQALDDYIVRFEFPFGIGKYPTAVVKGTRVRSLIAIESFVHEKRSIEAVVSYPPQLKLCNLEEYRIKNQNALRLPFVLRTENDVWYHLIEFEVPKETDVGKYEIYCTIDSMSIVAKKICKPFYIVDKNYALEHIRLKSFTAPSDEEGNEIPKQKPNTLAIKDPASRFFRTFFVNESEHEGNNISFVFENTGNYPVLLDVKYSIHNAANGTAVNWLDNLRQESGLDNEGLLLQVFIEPHNTTKNVITIRNRNARPVPGIYEQRLRASFFTSDAPFLDISKPLEIKEVNIANTSATGFALLVAVMGIIAMFVLRQKLWGTLTSREYILIALYAAIAFSTVSIPATVLSNLLHALLGPFSFLLTGVFSEVIAYLLIISLVVLLPRPGVITSFILVKFLLSAVVLGNLSIISFLWYPMRAVVLESAFYLSGIYDLAESFDKPMKKSGILWTAFIIAFADAFLSFVSLNMTMFFYRLFYAQWYIWMYVAISGFLYTFIAVPLALRLGKGLRKVVID